MRRTDLGAPRIVGVSVAMAALAFVGAGPTKKKDNPTYKLEETIGDVASIYGSTYKVEGVGLVIGLEGTGSDPAPSWQRTKLLDEMKKARVPQPERILETRRVSLVTVRATILAGITTEDKFDVEIELPTSSTTSSLAGGFLMTTQLAQRARTPEGEKDDKVIGSAVGPILIGSEAKPEDGRVGRVLGGGRAKEDAPYALSIKEARRSGKTSQLLETRLNTRFHQSEGSDLKKLVTAKTDNLLILKVPRTYHHNQDRYHKIIKAMPLLDDATLQATRVEKWGKELLDPKTAGMAALRLEGIGPNAASTLRTGLSSTDDTVRFFAAESLAYLNDSEGDYAKVLAEIAKSKPEFRLFALKALAANDQAASLLKLRSLMAEPDFELRYGAFDALRTLDATDPFLGRIKVMEDPPEPEADDMMAYQTQSIVPKKKPKRAEEPFDLFVVDCEGPPMIHVTRNKRSEVVLFGSGQKMTTPIVLGAGGPLLLNASDGDSRVQITKITTKNLDEPRKKVDSSLDLVDVIRSMAALNASYPEVALVLGGASTQKNLPGPFVVDSTPEPNKAYEDAQLSGLTAKKDGALKKTSGDSDRKSILDRVRGVFKR